MKEIKIGQLESGKKVFMEGLINSEKGLSELTSIESIDMNIDIIKDSSPTEDMCLHLKRRELTLKELLDTGFITQEQLDILINAFKEDKNIIIRGVLGCGKTTLLRALINEFKELASIPVERVTNTLLGKFNVVDYVILKDQSETLGKDEQPFEKIIFGEVNAYCMDSFFQQLNVGKHIVTTDIYIESEEEKVKRGNKKLNDYEKDTREKYPFVEVKISRVNEERKIESITDVMI